VCFRDQDFFIRRDGFAVERVADRFWPTRNVAISIADTVVVFFRATVSPDFIQSHKRKRVTLVTTKVVQYHASAIANVYGVIGCVVLTVA